MTPTQQGLAEWHTLATSPDPERLARLVAEGAVFHGPHGDFPLASRAHSLELCFSLWRETVVSCRTL